jgi:fructose-bisphosphate aldolase class II
MSIVKMDDLLARALKGKYGIGYFECWDQYSLEGAMEAAEESLSPAILGFGGAVTNPEWLESGGIEELASLTILLAERSKVPTAVLFNEAATMEQLARGLRARCQAVMLDTSYYPFNENVRVTRKVVEQAHAVGAVVEAELGHLPDAAGLDTHDSLTTDPNEAATFVAQTGVDALAISIGNAHSLSEGEATVDLDLLERIHRCVPVPLVIHGGTGFPQSAIRPAIERGVAKFNYGTRLKRLFLEGIKIAIEPIPEAFVVHEYVGSRTKTDVMACGKALMKEDILKMIRLYGSAGKAVNW